jgi:hypothetical protein
MDTYVGPIQLQSFGTQQQRINKLKTNQQHKNTPKNTIFYETHGKSQFSLQNYKTSLIK